MISSFVVKGARLLADMKKNREGSDIPEAWQEDFRTGENLESSTANSAARVSNGEKPDEIIKLMSPVSGSSAITFGANLIYGGDWNFANREQRLYRETNLRDNIGEHLNVVEDIKRNGSALRQEWIDSVPYKEWSIEANQEEFRNVTGNFLKDYANLLEAGFTLRDSRLSNLLVVDGKDPGYCWVDLEYAEEDATEDVQMIDRIQILESAKHLRPERYRDFRALFNENIGDVPEEVDLASDIASLVHALPYSLNDFQERNNNQNTALNGTIEEFRDKPLGYEPNKEWYENALENTDLDSYSPDVWMKLAGNSTEKALDAIDSEVRGNGFSYL